MDPYLPMDKVEEFIQKNNQTLMAKDNVDFDTLYTLMKQDLLLYKSYYEVRDASSY